MKLYVTDHAAEQYVARVKPALTIEQARAEMEALMAHAGAGATQEQAPPWTRPHPSHQDASYLVVSDGVAFVVNQTQTGIVTCLTRGGRSEQGRAARTERKRKKRAERRWRNNLSRDPRRGNQAAQWR